MWSEHVVPILYLLYATCDIPCHATCKYQTNAFFGHIHLYIYMCVIIYAHRWPYMYIWHHMTIWHHITRLLRHVTISLNQLFNDHPSIWAPRCDQSQLLLSRQPSPASAGIALKVGNQNEMIRKSLNILNISTSDTFTHHTVLNCTMANLRIQLQ